MSNKDYYHFDLFQEEALSTAIYPKGLAYPALGLAGEAGEVCEKIKKVIRDQDGDVDLNNRIEIKKELGDVLWYVAALAHELELDLSSVAEGVLIKLADRKKRNVLGGSGDNR